MWSNCQHLLGPLIALCLGFGSCICSPCPGGDTRFVDEFGRQADELVLAAFLKLLHRIQIVIDDGQEAVMGDNPAGDFHGDLDVVRQAFHLSSLIRVSNAQAGA